jgi:prevent-host-death family protein
MVILTTNAMGMNMKTISSKEAQNSFGAFLDSVQHEAVVVTRRNRPVGVMLPMNNLSALLEFADSIRETIKAGVKAGLADSAAGRGQELTDDYIDNLKNELQARINAKQNA